MTDSVADTSLTVVVMGMHRSGTSALAGALQSAGLDAGPEAELLPGRPENPAGFWERQDVIDFNNKLLVSLGWEWDTPDSMPLESPPLRESLVDEGRRLMAVLAGTGPFLVKDPRISVLLPWWREILYDRFIAVVAMRPPEEVAWSLALRNHLAPEVGMAIWAAYHRHLAAGLEGLPVVVVDYVALTTNPSSLVPKLLRAVARLGVTEPLDDKAAVESVQAALRRSTQPDFVANQNDVDSSIHEIAELWRGDGPVWVNERFSLETPRPHTWETALLDAHRRERNSEVGRHSDLDAWRLSESSLRSEIEALHTNLKQERSAGEKQSQELTALQSKLDSSRAVTETLERQVEADGAETNRLRQELGELRAELDTDSAETNRLRQELGALRAELETDSAETNRLHQELDSLRAELDSVRAELDSVRAERDTGAAVNRALEQHWELTHANAETLRQELITLRFELVSLRADLDAARTLAQPKRLRDRLFGSTGDTAVDSPDRGQARLGGSARRVLRELSLVTARTVVRITPRAVLPLIWRNPLLDASWYLDRYADVRQKGISANRHYRRHGVSEGRMPNRLFDPYWYLHTYSDVRNAGLDPLDHYFLFGVREGRNPSPLFDTDWYLYDNPDVRESKMNPLLHYLQLGVREGRAPTPPDWEMDASSAPDEATPVWAPPETMHVPHDGLQDVTQLIRSYFDEHHYRATNSEVDFTQTDPFEHYTRVGCREGKTPNPVFDVAGYVFDNPDVVSMDGNVLEHYATVGRHRDATPHPLFDAHWYARRYADVAQGGGDPYQHYLRIGIREGRSTSEATEDGVDLTRTSVSFEIPTNEQVTVIVPAFKNYALTYRCLYALSQRTPRGAYAVIIADDCPAQPLGPVLDATGAKITLNRTNLGFLANCNRASRGVAGDYIMFLNSDTVVREGWLPPLLELMERDRLVALVGPKMLGADGELSEAGWVMFRDGWGHPYGRGDAPGRPEYDYVRQVDCVTGAALFVRRRLFEEVGRFDRRYAPAFFEEFDLAFKFEDAGYRVMYQPASEVVHYRGGSYTEEMRNRQSGLNHEKFVTKWSDRLGRQYEGERDLFLARERPHRSGTILVIDDRVPEHDKHAGGLTMHQYIRLMRDLDFKVVFLPDDGLTPEPYASQLRQLGVEVLNQDVDTGKWLRTNGRYLQCALIARPEVAPKYIPLIRRWSRARILYYPHDLHYLREQRRFAVTGDPSALRESQRLLQIERNVFGDVDGVLSPSAAEALSIKDLVPTAEVTVLPPYYWGPDDFRPPIGNLAARSDVLFVGGFAHLPNVDAASHLARDIMPIVWQEVPDARLILVGSDPPPHIRSLANHRVKVTGHVPDLRPLYERARVTVSPIRYGAGVKGKVISSVVEGVPVVTTAIGNEGIDLADNVEAMIADDVPGLATSVVKLFQDNDLAQALAENAQAAISRHFSRAAARRALLQSLRLRICPVCGTRAPTIEPLAETTNWREEFACNTCFALNRSAELAQVIIARYGGAAAGASIAECLGYLTDLHIHEFGASGPIAGILSSSPLFSKSEYFDDVPLGGKRSDGTTCQDLTRLTYGDQSFDVVLTQDVFEHVSDPELAFREVYRVLRPGGSHIFTVPYSPKLNASRKRARVTGDVVEDLLPRVYHRDPIRPEGALVVTDFGNDLSQLLETIGFRVRLHETLVETVDVRGGGFVVVFETTRPSDT